MAQTHAVQAAAPPAIGALLQYWRKTWNMSQLALANEAAGVARHVCFLETGCAKPSREMVLHLADTLSVPLRERNALLMAAGYAPMFRESSLDAPQLASVRAAIDAILAKQEPYPAVVMNRGWDIVATNQAAARLFGMLLGRRAVPDAGNVLRLMFHPDGLRPCVTNWEAVARALVQRSVPGSDRRRPRRRCAQAPSGDSRLSRRPDELGHARPWPRLAARSPSLVSARSAQV